MKKLSLLGVTMLLGTGLTFARPMDSEKGKAPGGGKKVLRTSDKSPNVYNAHKGGKSGKGNAKYVEENSFTVSANQAGGVGKAGNGAAPGKVSLDPLSGKSTQQSPTSKALPRPPPPQQQPPDRDKRGKKTTWSAPLCKNCPPLQNTRK